MASVLGLKCSSSKQGIPLHTNTGYTSPSFSAHLRKNESRISLGVDFTLNACGFKKLRIHSLHGSMWSLRAASASESGGIVETTEFGEPISLGTMKLPSNVDLKKLESFLFQWGNSLTQSANVPLPAPLKVDRVKGGVRLGFIKVNEGKVEDLVYIDCLVFPPEGGSNAVFRALRNGQLKNETPPGEQVIMQSLLQALKKSIDLSRT